MAAQLYGLPMDEFTSARNARVKEARAADEATVARALQRLRKPTLAAWLVNQLVRRHGPEMEVLLDLGRELRAGMGRLDGEELRQLTRRRHQLVSALVRQAAGLDDSRRLSNDVEAAVRATLEATLSDATSADAVAAGQLTEPLDVSGFGAGIFGAQPPSATEPAGPAEVVDLDDRRNRRTQAVKEAEAAVADTQKRARRATARRADADKSLQALKAERDDAEAVVSRLREELATAEADLDDRVRRVDEARRTHDNAVATADEAQRHLAEAQKRLQELRGR